MLQDLLAAVGSVDHPYMKPEPPALRRHYLDDGDKGLAGSFNANLIRVGESCIAKTPTASGIRSATRRATRTPARWGCGSHLAAAEPDKLVAAREIAAQVSDDFVAGRISTVQLISPKLVNMMSQRPETRQLLPVVRPRPRRRPTDRASG